MQKFTPLEYLQIDIANLYGKDKLNWIDRLSWFKQNKDNLFALKETADSPNQFYAAICNYDRAANGAVNNHPIALDATSSGTQLLACLIGDRKAAEYCNVLNAGKRVDAYTELFKQLPEEVQNNPSITRELVKKAIMTSLYGSMTKPKELFGEHVDAFYSLMNKECPLVWELNEFLSSNWNDKVDSYGWVMPDNFHVHIKVYVNEDINFRFNNRDYSITHKVNKPNLYGRAYSANLAHSVDSLIVREITALAMHNPKQITKVRGLLDKEPEPKVVNQSNLNMVTTLVQRYNETGFLSARILDYIDGHTIKYVPKEELIELLAAVPNKPFKVICIHDSFKVLPNYGNDLRQLYTLQLAKIAKSSLLQHILDSLPVPKVQIEKGDPNMWKDVLNAEYALS